MQFIIYSMAYLSKRGDYEVLSMARERQQEIHLYSMKTMQE